MIDIRATYYATEKKDMKTNETVFTVSPFHSYPFVKDGLLRCIGKTYTCIKGMPVIIKGDYNEKRKAFVLNGYIKTDVDGYDAVSSIIRLIDPDITEAVIASLCNETRNDLFTYCETRQKTEDGLYEKLIKGKNIKQLSEEKKCEECERQRNNAKKIVAFVESIKKDKEMSQFLLQYDIPADRIEKIIKKNVSIEKIKRNPYFIAETYDVSMLAADEIAWDTSFGSSEESGDGHSFIDYDELRLVEYAKYAARKISSSGSTAFTLRSLISEMNKVFYYESISRTAISKSLANFCVSEPGSGLAYHDICGQKYIELNSIWKEETTAIFHMKRLAAGSGRKYRCRSVKETEAITGIKYNKGQEAAFDIPKTGGVKILTGPPGSGKTAAVRGLIESFSLSGGTVKLAATTGMAAKVLSDATGQKAQTLNMMLNIMPFDNDNVYSKNTGNPVDADFIIVDEVSMLGLKMFSALLQAVKSGAVLLLVGDEDQLQSVEYGNVLHDIIKSGSAEVFRLTEILRQSGTICANAVKVNCGRKDLVCDKTFHIIRCTSADDMLFELKANYHSSGSQILCPVKNGPVSVAAVNDAFEQKNREPLALYGRKKFYMNDKIVMTHTNYEEKYINGEIGIVIGKCNDKLICIFDDKEREMSRESLHDMEHADCITIHKSQGNEFNTVHILLPKEAMTMMTQKLLYTAITRAKKSVYIYTSGDTLNSAISNRAERKRVTLLAERLAAEAKKAEK